MDDLFSDRSVCVGSEFLSSDFFVVGIEWLSEDELGVFGEWWGRGLLFGDALAMS